MTAETAAFDPAATGCTAEITDEDENAVIAFIPFAVSTSTSTSTFTSTSTSTSDTTNNNINDIVIGNSNSSGTIMEKS